MAVDKPKLEYTVDQLLSSADAGPLERVLSKKTTELREKAANLKTTYPKELEPFSGNPDSYVNAKLNEYKNQLRNALKTGVSEGEAAASGLDNPIQAITDAWNERSFMPLIKAIPFVGNLIAAVMRWAGGFLGGDNRSFTEHREDVERERIADKTAKSKMIAAYGFEASEIKLLFDYADKAEIPTDEQKAAAAKQAEADTAAAKAAQAEADKNAIIARRATLSRNLLDYASRDADNDPLKDHLRDVVLAPLGDSRFFVKVVTIGKAPLAGDSPFKEPATIVDLSQKLAGLYKYPTSQMRQFGVDQAGAMAAADQILKDHFAKFGTKNDVELSDQAKAALLAHFADFHVAAIAAIQDSSKILEADGRGGYKQAPVAPPPEPKKEEPKKEEPKKEEPKKEDGAMRGRENNEPRRQGDDALAAALGNPANSNIKVGDDLKLRLPPPENPVDIGRTLS